MCLHRDEKGETMSGESRTVGILVFDDVEVLDFCGPFEVFSVSRAPGVTGDVNPLFRAVTIAEEDRIINCRGGLLLQPHYTIANHPELDILVVPGGQGTRKERHNQRLLDWITLQDSKIELLTSVCTGSFLLAEAGKLEGLKATTHWGSIDVMRENYPSTEMLSNVRFVDEGRVITSAGISAGIDMSLHIVERLHGRETAAWTARRMEYDWAVGEV
jgi:transcriptional regulator GlxA family with amidase domain